MINERNRRRDLEDAEKACVQEMAERKQATADPFTRRRCLPTLVTKVYTSHMLFVVVSLVSFVMCFNDCFVANCLLSPSVEEY